MAFLKKDMQAMEFEEYLENSVIHLPISYQHWQEGKPVEVIVLVDENSGAKPKQEGASSINRHAGKIALTEDSLDFQKKIATEWA